MTGKSRKQRSLVADNAGSVAMEFGLLGPLFLAMLLGLFQIAVAMQAYNAVRNLTADVVRYTSVQYQTGNNLQHDQVENYAKARGSSTPYMLNRDNLSADVIDAATQRVAGAKEFTLTVTYQVPTVMDLFGLESPSLSYSQPIFVVGP